MVRISVDYHVYFLSLVRSSLVSDDPKHRTPRSKKEEGVSSSVPVEHRLLSGDLSLLCV